MQVVVGLGVINGIRIGHKKPGAGPGGGYFKWTIGRFMSLYPATLKVEIVKALR